MLTDLSGSPHYLIILHISRYRPKPLPTSRNKLRCCKDRYQKILIIYSHYYMKTILTSPLGAWGGLFCNIRHSLPLTSCLLILPSSSLLTPHSSFLIPYLLLLTSYSLPLIELIPHSSFLIPCHSSSR